VVSITAAFAMVLLLKLVRVGSFDRELYASGTDMAGALGFEPRSSVLETDSLTVELTPL
jgi:hypothetical protein